MNRLDEAIIVLENALGYTCCDMCDMEQCMWCEQKNLWRLSHEKANRLVQDIIKASQPTGVWKKYTDSLDEYYCSHCSYPAPCDAYGKFRDQPAYCPVCGTRMIDKESLVLAKEYGE